MKNWYAVQTKPRQEKLAEENLARQGFETFLPQISLRKRRRNQWQYVTEALFSNYLFICVNPNETSLAPVRSTLGVSKLVRFGPVIKAVPGSAIQFLKVQQNDSAGQQRPLSCGDKVEILEGSFEGLTGIYQMDKGGDRALLLIDFLARQITVQVHKDKILAAS